MRYREAKTFRAVVSSLSFVFLMLFSGCSTKYDTIDYYGERNSSILKENSFWMDLKRESYLFEILDSALEESFALSSKKELISIKNLEYLRAKSSDEVRVDGQLSSNLKEEIDGNFESRGSNLSLLASYDFDFWRSKKSQELISLYGSMIAIENLKDATSALSIEIASLVFEIEERRELLILIEDELEASEKLKKAIEVRFKFNKASRADILKNEIDILTLKEEIKNQKSALELLTFRLEKFTNKKIKDSFQTKFLEIFEDNFYNNKQLLSDTLYALPKIRAHSLEVKQKDSRVHYEIAKSMPSFAFSISLLSSGDNLLPSFERLFLESMLRVVAPIFDAKESESRKEIAKRELKESFYRFQDALLKESYALFELSKEIDRKKESIELLKNKISLALETYRTLQHKFLYGKASYIELESILNSKRAFLKSLLKEEREYKILAFKASLTLHYQNADKPYR